MKSIFSENTWTAMRDALNSGRKAVAILPCGATEAHGPHLPLNTDVIISETMAERALPVLVQRGYAAFVLPSLAYMPAEYAQAFPGTVTVSAATARMLILDIAACLQAQGFACIALANSHFDPSNVAMLRAVSDEIRARGLTVAFPDFTRRKLAQRLTAEFQSGACHAGQYETSLVLAIRPDLVDEGVCRVLVDNPSSLTEAFNKGARTFEEAGGSDAYFGYPRTASSHEGEETFDIMAGALVEAIEAVLPRSPHGPNTTA